MGQFGVFIPILALMIPIIAIWTRHQQRMAEVQISMTADRTAERAAQYATSVKELEDRVRVLERIATDKGVHLAAEIEDLRASAEIAEAPRKELN